jgi:hypothetical protein
LPISDDGVGADVSFGGCAFAQECILGTPKFIICLTIGKCDVDVKLFSSSRELKTIIFPSVRVSVVKPCLVCKIFQYAVSNY